MNVQTIACKPEINEHSMNACSFDADTNKHNLLFSG